MSAATTTEVLPIEVYDEADYETVEIDDTPVYDEAELFAWDPTEEEPYYEQCECEIDWTCPLCKAAGRFGGYTYIEVRYQGLDDEERGW